MIARIAAPIFIFTCTSVARAILGATIFSRTYNSAPTLKNKVVSSWRSPQKQSPPDTTYSYPVTNKSLTKEDGKSVEKITETEAWAALPLESTQVDIALVLEHRQKGLIWYITYKEVLRPKPVRQLHLAFSR